MAVLLINGNHVPITPLLDTVGNGFNDAPLQIGPTGLKVGIIVKNPVSERLCSFTTKSFLA